MTDPIRDFYDGACLHIVRHYHPSKVVLFLTAEVETIHKKYSPYTRAIESVAPGTLVEIIESHITNPQLYDEFIEILPKKIYGLHDKYPDEEIILNLSSGTPQMKNLLAIIAIETDWAHAVQVNSPANRSGRSLIYIKCEDDFKIMLEGNLDNEPDSINRCIEPPLKVISHYNDKNRVRSLIDSYDYSAALKIVNKNKYFSEDVKKLIEHAKHRTTLFPDKAKKILSKYNGIALCPFTDTKEELMEYFLTIQNDQKTERLFDVLLKTTPFIYEFLLEYIKISENIEFEKICEYRGVKQFYLRRDLLENYNSELLSFLDNKFIPKLRDTDLSSLILKYICKFFSQSDSSNRETHLKVLVELEKIKKVAPLSIYKKDTSLRNYAAHIIINVNENKFYSMTGIHSNEVVNSLFNLLTLLYNDITNKQRNLYNRMNIWIKEAMEK